MWIMKCDVEIFYKLLAYARSYYVAITSWLKFVML